MKRGSSLLELAREVVEEISEVYDAQDERKHRKSFLLSIIYMISIISAIMLLWGIITAHLVVGFAIGMIGIIIDIIVFLSNKKILTQKNNLTE